MYDDYSFIEHHFTLLDAKLDSLVTDIQTSADPDGMGLLDDAEYLIGMGFLAAQHFMTTAFSWRSIPKKVALDSGPIHPGGQLYAMIINAAANFWKHVEEWDFHTIVHRDKNGLETFQCGTMTVIESVTPWADYTLANLLHELVGEPKLSLLLPILRQWSGELQITPVGPQC